MKTLIILTSKISTYQIKRLEDLGFRVVVVFTQAREVKQ